jgi:hypothetical protein
VDGVQRRLVDVDGDVERRDHVDVGGMNFKRGRRKNARAGCLYCKPHKANGADRRTAAERRMDADVREARATDRED